MVGVNPLLKKKPFFTIFSLAPEKSAKNLCIKKLLPAIKPVQAMSKTKI